MTITLVFDWPSNNEARDRGVLNIVYHPNRTFKIIICEMLRKSIVWCSVTSISAVLKLSKIIGGVFVSVSRV